MKNTYQILIDKLPNAQNLKLLLESLHRSFAKLGLDYVIIGAFVRDIWLKHIHQVTEPKRATHDIDFAFEMENIEQYTQLFKYLIDNEDFTPTKNKFRLISPQRIEIDLCPFGAIELETNFVNWITDNKSDARIPSTIGLSEALEQGEEVILKNKANKAIPINVITLEILVILKLIAWNDRPEVRQKDAEDLALILDNYQEIYWDEIIEIHFDLLIEFDGSPWKCGARLLGRKLQMILVKYGNLKQTLVQILENQVNNPEKCKLALAMCENTEQYEQKLEILRLIFQGLNDELSTDFDKE
jgi:predicted nucleotidyltransferase